MDSGTSAIELALRALGIGPGDEVITPANTFIASVLAISYVGATPVLVDVEPGTANIDPRLLEQAITERTKAVLPVHLYGQPADLAAVQEICDRHGLELVEDACQAHGATYRGKRAGGFGRVAAFSFYPAKNLGAYGDGGMVVTDDPAVAEEMRLLRNYGSREKYYHEIRGYNRRLDTLHAAVLHAKLPHLDGWNEARRRHAASYASALASLPVELPAEHPDSGHVYHLYVIRAPDRDALRAHLTERGIATGVHYPLPVHLQRAYRDLGHREGDFPVTEALARQILSLPMFPELTEEAIGRVAEEIAAHTRGLDPAGGPRAASKGGIDLP